MMLNSQTLVAVMAAMVSFVRASPVAVDFLADYEVVNETDSRFILDTRASDPGFDYSNTKVRGVNLGGWFLTEPFITPSLYEAFGAEENTPVDEYHYSLALGKDEARKRLENHWNNFYSQQDFSKMKELGLNHVRIPVGYWAFVAIEGDPYVQGQEKYLDRAIEWARSAGLKVWVDLHGVPGSQNGFDNSGQRDKWDFLNGNNVDIAIKVLEYIAEKYGGPKYSEVVTAIQLVNEPLAPAIGIDGVKSFYNRGYDTVRSKSRSVGVSIHDAFQANAYWNGFFDDNSQHYFVILDHHHYQIFSPGEVSRNIDQHIQTACQVGWDTRFETKWRVVGEFSAALTDCTKWLNGVGRKARYDGSFPGSSYVGSCDNRNDVSSWTQQQKQESRRYLEAQLEAYEQGNGWIFWTWKTENAFEWDYQRLVDAEIMPYPIDNRQFPNTCGFWGR